MVLKLCPPPCLLFAKPANGPGTGSGTLGVAGPNGEGDTGMGSGTLAQPMGDPELEERRKRQEERVEQRKAEEVGAISCRRRRGCCG